MSGDVHTEDFLFKFDIEKSEKETKKLTFQIIGLPPLSITLDSDGTVDAHITSITAPDRLFLSQKLANLSRLSVEWEADPPKPLQENEIGRFAMVRLPDYKGSLNWMRTVVLERKRTFAEILAIDSGTMAVVPLPSLFKMTHEWIPIAPYAFPVRVTNSSSQIFPNDIKRLLWKKVNVRIESVDDKNFLCDELNFYTVQNELINLSLARTENLSSFIAVHNIAPARYSLTEKAAPQSGTHISIPGTIVASLGAGLALFAVIFFLFMAVDLMRKTTTKEKKSDP